MRCSQLQVIKSIIRIVCLVVDVLVCLPVCRVFNRAKPFVTRLIPIPIQGWIEIEGGGGSTNANVEVLVNCALEGLYGLHVPYCIACRAALVRSTIATVPLNHCVQETQE